MIEVDFQLTLLISAINKPNYSLQLSSLQQLHTTMSSDKSVTEKAKDMAGAAKDKMADVRWVKRCI